MRSGAATLDQSAKGQGMSDTWLKMSMGDLGRGIGAGKIDPVALAECYLDAAQNHPLSTRIYARFTPQRARSEAQTAAQRAKNGQRRSLIDGIPISWKDLFDTSRVATEAGSALLAGRTPKRDAKVLRAATNAGLVCLGKTHMSELAFSGLGYNPSTQSPPCVNDPEAVSGGSSSGGAASVAFGLAAGAIGSDTGGSVRIPSAWNDLVGLKTTAKRLSLEGVVPLCESFDTVGPLCRSVEDAALMLGALEGQKPADLRGASLQGRRFLELETVAFDDVRDAPLKAYEAARDKLIAAGATVERRAIPEVAEAMDLTGVLFTTEAYAQWRDVIEANPQAMFGEILQRFRSGANWSGAEFAAGWKRLHMLRAIYAQKTAHFDAVIFPTAPIMPPNMQRLATDHDYYVAENLLALRNTRIGNLMGLCGLTLPTGTPCCGILLNGAPWQEEKLLRHGAACEAALA
ncbi:MAG: aspartyl-tRNA(Asn)/glutamyl-tRNA(Gln) amidotransferase subunit A [Halocynthiibacter sp.]|jgi:aspartyl-tRNA(Asn)/glutamyl-tRNA(Gln) amidotransferase subunit A